MAARCGCAPLTLERTPHGWIQRAAFTHPDLHDELVDELVSLDSPFATACGSGATAVFTFLLLGDQNAGKSTFLHAFAHHADSAWLELGSFLPILTSSFLNAALTQSSSPPMDEPPFVDTDVGRASFLLTLEDFAFFVNEFELGDAVPLERLAAQRTQYAAVQLIEIGGDHLDRMLDGGDELGGVVGRSEALVAASQKSVYFLNGSTLLAPAAGALELVPDALALLLRRLRYLRGVLPAGQEVLFYLSRLPPPRPARLASARRAWRCARRRPSSARTRRSTRIASSRPPCAAPPRRRWPPPTQTRRSTRRSRSTRRRRRTSPSSAPSSRRCYPPRSRSCRRRPPVRRGSSRCSTRCRRAT